MPSKKKNNKTKIKQPELTTITKSNSFDALHEEVQPKIDVEQDQLKEECMHEECIPAQTVDETQPEVSFEYSTSLLKNYMEDQKEMVDKLTKDLDLSREKEAMLEEQVNALQEKSCRDQEEIRDLMEQIDSLHAEVADLSQQVMVFSNECQKEQGMKIILSAHIDSLEAQKSSLEAQLASLQDCDANSSEDASELVSFFIGIPSLSSYIASFLADVDIPTEQKLSTISLLSRNQAIVDIPKTILDAGLADEWDVAFGLLSQVAKQDMWEVLRKMLSNWESMRDRRRCKELCVMAMEQAPNAMKMLNEFAKRQFQVRGYCDVLKQQDAKTFAMNYSEL